MGNRSQATGTEGEDVSTSSVCHTVSHDKQLEVLSIRVLIMICVNAVCKEEAGKKTNIIWKG